jgi:hypothetical protein
MAFPGPSRQGAKTGKSTETKGADISTGALAVLAGTQNTQNQKKAEHDAWLAGIQPRNAPEKQNPGLWLPRFLHHHTRRDYDRPATLERW